MSASLSTQTTKITGIISLKEADYLDCCEVMSLLKAWLEGEARQYAFILHNADITASKEFAIPHIHFTAELKKRSRLATILNRVAVACNVSPFAVSIDKYNSFEACVQYLIHKHEPDKFQYDKSMIVKSFDDDLLNTYLECDGFTLDFDHLVRVCMESENILEVGHKIGLGYFGKYRSAIHDIFHETRVIPVSKIEQVINKEV